MRRREFVRKLPVATAGLAVGASLPLTGCAGVPHVMPSARPNGLAVPGGAVGAGGFIMVQAPDMERPILLVRDESGGLVALLASCTHQGCQLPAPVGDRLVCPCHGSEFALTGDVLEGPADRPLERFEVTEERGEIVVRVPRRD